MLQMPIMFLWKVLTGMLYTKNTFLSIKVLVNIIEKPLKEAELLLSRVFLSEEPKKLYMNLIIIMTINLKPR